MTGRTASRTADRTAAAALLRAARTADAPDAVEALQWAVTVRPDSRPVQRRLIDRLIDAGEADDAAAALARALLIDPQDPDLLRLEARLLLVRGEVQRAAQVIAASLQRRPGRVATMRVAARIAEADGRWMDAAAWWRRILARRPEDDAAAGALAAALIHADRLDEARTLLMSRPDVPPSLAARLLVAEGRPLDALRSLDRALAQADAHAAAEVDAMHVARLEALEALGDEAGLRTAMGAVADDQPQAMWRAGLALLSMGRFMRAVVLLREASRLPTVQRQARHALVVALCSAGDHEAAQEALTALMRSPGGVDRHLMAGAWWRAMRGRLLREQTSATAAGADPDARILPTLLEDAAASCEAAEAAGLVVTRSTAPSR